MNFFGCCLLFEIRHVIIKVITVFILLVLDIYNGSWTWKWFGFAYAIRPKNSLISAYPLGQAAGGSRLIWQWQDTFKISDVQFSLGMKNEKNRIGCNYITIGLKSPEGDELEVAGWWFLVTKFQDGYFYIETMITFILLDG